jgi:ribosomal protein S6--L-glutamate ligase
LLQDVVVGDGTVRKLYVVGNEVRALLEPDRATEGSTRAPFPPSASLIELATRIGVALRLDVFGVDVIEGPDGPRVIDVNPFPGLRGIADGANLLAHHLQALARERPRIVDDLDHDRSAWPEP